MNIYYKDRLEKNNIILELNCALQKTDVFEPIQVTHRLKDNDSLGEVEPLNGPFTIDHQEGDIISIIFVNAR